MACFIVPATEAVITTITAKVIEKKELKEEIDIHSADISGLSSDNGHTSFRLSKKMKWLNNMLWGGSALLAFEHLWHGEIVPWAPFLTAASSKKELFGMFHEMSTVGVSMAVLVTFIWGIMVLLSNRIEKRISETANLASAYSTQAITSDNSQEAL